MDSITQSDCHHVMNEVYEGDGGLTEQRLFQIAGGEVQ